MANAVDEPLLEVLHSGYIGQGKVVEKLEHKLCDYLNTNNLLTTNSATSAEHLALHLLKQPNEFIQLNNNDEVLTTPLTCMATNAPITMSGLRIKWVDINENNLNIDIEDLKRKLTPFTKAIVVVHWGGYPVDLDAIKEVQLLYKQMFNKTIPVIEDCAHAFGSNFNKIPIGTHGNFCTFSFQAIKMLTAVDGGALVTPTKQLYDQAKLLRWYGISRETTKTDMRCELDVAIAGTKWHMNDVNAIICLNNLEVVDKAIKKHKANAKYYDNNLVNIPGVTLLKRDSRMDSAFWIYSILVDDRPGFMKMMGEKGIVVSQVHERNDKHTCFSEFVSYLPTTDKIVPKLCNIPVGWWVSNEDREYIVDTIKGGW